MKVNLYRSIIGLAISGLIAYALYEFGRSQDNSLLLAIGGFVTTGVPLIFALGVKTSERGVSTNLSLVSSLFFLFAIISNTIFAFLQSFSTATYIIPNAIILLVFALIYGSIGKSHT